MAMAALTGCPACTSRGDPSLSRRIQKRDQVGHLPLSQSRPLNVHLFHRLEHRGAMSPQRRHHRHCRELACSFRKIRSFTRTGVTACARFAGKNFSAGVRIAAIFKVLVCPDVTEKLLHFSEFERLGLSGHLWRMVPHRDSDIGQCFPAQPVAQIQFAFMTVHTAFGRK